MKFIRLNILHGYLKYCIIIVNDSLSVMISTINRTDYKCIVLLPYACIKA